MNVPRHPQSRPVKVHFNRFFLPLVKVAVLGVSRPTYCEDGSQYLLRSRVKTRPPPPQKKTATIFCRRASHACLKFSGRFVFSRTHSKLAEGVDVRHCTVFQLSAPPSCQPASLEL